MEKYIINGSTLTGIADGVRKVTGTTDKMKPDEMAAALNNIDVSGGGYGEGYTAGQQAEYDRFWDSYQDLGKRSDYSYSFSGQCWTDITFLPKYDIKPTGTGTYGMFFNSMVTGDLVALCEKQGIIIDVSGCNAFSAMFTNCKFTRVGTLNFSNAQLRNVFENAKNLKIIDKLIVAEKAQFISTFSNTKALEEIRFEGVIGNDIGFSSCSLLSAESVQSIIDALKDLTGTTAKKVQFHSDVVLKLTDEQLATITAKNWTI